MGVSHGILAIGSRTPRSQLNCVYAWTALFVRLTINWFPPHVAPCKET